MKREGYDRALHRAPLIAVGLDDGEPHPAEHHGGGVRRHRERVDRRPVPGRYRARPAWWASDSMVYSHFFGPVGVKKQRATLRRVGDALKGAALPLVIPIIILGGILTGWFTPTEAG
mgnify:CR=1 FL=1